MTGKEIKKLFDSFNSMNIMIIGDVMIDAYLWGHVDRVSPEAPIPIVSVAKKEYRLGGAANVALNIQALGARPVLCSITGNNEKSGLFMELMRDNDLDPSGIIISGDRKTTVKTRIISSNQQLLRVDEENPEKVSKNAETRFAGLIGSILSEQRIDAVIFEDYDKGVITPGLINEIRKITSERGIPVAADPKKRNFAYYRDIDLYTPNLKELADGLRTEISKNDLEGIRQGANKLQEKNNIKYLMVTLSEKGIYLSYNDKGKLVPAVIRGVADVSGAGDTVISVATACLAAGSSAESMTVLANIAGGQVCEKVGVVPVDKKQLLEEIVEYYKTKALTS